MIVGVEGTNHAGKRLHQRAFKPGVALPGEQAILLHHLVGDHHVGGFAADPWKRITGAVRAIRQLQVGLNHIALAGVKLVLPFFADGDNLPAELMADNDWVCRHIVRHLFVVLALVRLFPGGEAQTVGDHPGENFIILHRRKFKGFQAQIAFAVEPQGCCCLHVYHLIPFIFRITAAKSFGSNLLK